LLINFRSQIGRLLFNRQIHNQQLIINLQSEI